jgi:ADP-ribose pyrophosphatase YjhB (NUDIX family)
MAIAEALRELLAAEPTQASVAARLTDHGLPTDQTKVSAWLRGRVPNVEQLATIEDVFGKPRGWVLSRAGYVDAAGLVSDRFVGDSASAVTKENQIRALHVEVRLLRKALLAAEAEAERLRALTPRARRLDPARTPRSRKPE